MSASHFGAVLFVMVTRDLGISPSAALGYRPQTVVVCQGDQVGLVCDQGFKPIVVQAFWGRLAKGLAQATCPQTGDSNATSRLCQAPQSAVDRIIVLGCYSVDHECYFPAVVEVLGDPCPGTHKYLNATYFCARKSW